ncbi:MAG: alkaline phosphatase family protein, partial [Calditerrivibrio sp.]|nr:alkaline phosphatase family protein [Calditerrivibrio sp.]
MIRKILFISFFIFYSLSSFAQSGSVIVISIDALHPDAIKAVKPENIGKLMNKGVYNLNGKSVNPPKTLISHTAMFTGLLPEDSGYTSNVWKVGEPTVKGSTIFEDAKKNGFKTYYVYSKQKLGFLENKFIDRSIFGKDDSVAIVEKIIKNEKKPFFIFLHISGLDDVGPKYGFLSNEYLDEFKLIDEDLKDIIDYFIKLDKSTIIVTSDHSGHEKEHGTEDPEDYKLP